MVKKMEEYVDLANNLSDFARFMIEKGPVKFQKWLDKQPVEYKALAKEVAATAAGIISAAGKIAIMVPEFVGAITTLQITPAIKLAQEFYQESTTFLGKLRDAFTLGKKVVAEVTPALEKLQKIVQKEMKYVQEFQEDPKLFLEAHTPEKEAERKAIKPKKQ